MRIKIIISLVVTIMVSSYVALISDTIREGLWVALLSSWSLYVVGAVAIVIPAFLLVVIPTFACLRRLQRRISTAWAFTVGSIIALVVIVLPAWIRGVSLSLSVLIAGIIGGGVGVVTYTRLQLTALVRRMISGMQVAAAGTFLWAVVWSMLHNRHGSSPDWGLLILFPLGFILISSWFVLPMGCLLGVWLPRLVEGLQPWVSFIFGSILGTLVGCTAVMSTMFLPALWTIRSGIVGEQFESVQSVLIETMLNYAVTMIPIAALCVAFWALKSSRGLSQERTA